MIPYSRTRELLQLSGRNPDLSPEDRTVRGTLVKGLTDEDVELLDTFEGNVRYRHTFHILLLTSNPQEYSREIVSVHPLGPFIPLSTSSADIAPTTPPPIPPLSTISSTHPPIQTHIYIWSDALGQLKSDIWEFAEFVRTNAWKWVGDGEAVSQNEDYLEVDKRRDMGGVIIRRAIVDGDESESGEDGANTEGEGEGVHKKVVVELERTAE